EYYCQVWDNSNHHYIF
nr:immunoglobulin light chain junction region [Macaca mulatta]MOX44731.1 immunoglobulin light chain junction region [Macaca mulatta]MOX45829.1 immunoglobulin light chain junction region [Macaca mulatta]